MNIQAYVREDGGVGVRNHILILPSVVCANQVAKDIADAVPSAVHVEHQHGCAQVGVDFDQTKRLFVNMALHPNVYGVLVVGLGCEAVAAELVAEEMKGLTQKPVVPLLIQACGGTAGARERGIEEATRMASEAEKLQRTEVSMSRLTAAVQLAGHVPPSERTASMYDAIVEQLRDEGLTVIVGGDDARASVHLDYAERNTVGTGIVSMQTPHHAVEQLTGLVASGAQLVVALSDDLLLLGSPIAPVWSLCTEPSLYEDLPSEFDAGISEVAAAADGCTAHPTNDEVGRRAELGTVLSALGDYRSSLAQVFSGSPTVAEAQELRDFAIYRIGPTM